MDIKPFDIVLFNTNTPLGYLQRFVYKLKGHPSNITHVAIMYSKSLIFEAHTHLRFYPLSKYNPDNIAIIRVKPCDQIDVNAFHQLCESLYGLEYDYVQLIDDLLYMVTDDPRGNSRKFVCSELVAYLIYKMCGLKQLNYLFNLNDYRIVMPYHFSTIDKSKIEIIYEGKKFKW